MGLYDYRPYVRKITNNRSDNFVSYNKHNKVITPPRRRRGGVYL